MDVGTNARWSRLCRKTFAATGPILLSSTALAGFDSPVAMPERSSEVNVVAVYAADPDVGSSWFSAGGAVADFTNNGLPDIFLVSGGQSLDRLFINQGDGTFQDEGPQWFSQLHSGNGAAAGDFNSNGYIDLYVTSFGNVEDGQKTPGRNKLFQNDGGRSFTNVAEEVGVAWVNPDFACGYGANWGDYNLNGHLDLFVACWWPSPTQTSVLFRNNGDGTFTDVTIEAGVHDATVFGFQGAFADMNGDGWPDLLLAADFGTSRYYRNNGDGTFTDITAESGTGIDSHGMGQAIGDVNNSGLLDWYVTSIWPLANPIPGHEPGNMLYINQGDHTYIEIGQQAGVHDGLWGWGAIAVDLDQDGWMELIEVNGRFLNPLWYQKPPRLFYNNADGTFTEVAEAAGMFHGDEGRAVMRIDADRNGLQDIVVTNNFGAVQPSRYYRNETPDAGNWIGIHFDTSTNPLLAPNGFGTRVTVEAGGNSYLRYVHGDPSYLGTSELNVHFGLGSASVIDAITIQWPRGYVTTLHDVPANQYLQVTAPALADLTADGAVGVADLLQLLSLWGPVESAHHLHADLNNDGVVNTDDLLMLLAAWGS